MSTLLAFVGVAALVICSPGPDTALTIRSTLIGGRRHGLLTAAGIGTGQLIWTVAAAIGIAKLIEASHPVFTGIQLVGAVYLVVLGASSLWSAWRSKSPAQSSPPAVRHVSWWRAYAVGVINDLSNPKMAVFFLSLLPQFSQRGRTVDFLLLGCVFAVMTFSWLSIYAVLFDRARKLFSRSSVRRALDTACGIVLVGLGLRVAAEARG